MEKKLDLHKHKLHRRGLALRFFAALLSIFSLFVFTNCEVGLGEAVDTESPTVTISYPPRASVVRENFILAGTANDDKGVSRVEVSVMNTTLGINYGTKKASLSGSNWELAMNSRNGDGTYPLLDGNYIIDVQAYDDSGRSSGKSSLSLDIDNTAPVLILSKPYTSGNDAGPSSYGRRFQLTGDKYDAHTISKAVLKYAEFSGSDLSGEEEIFINDFSQISADNPLVVAEYYTAEEANTPEKLALRNAYVKLYGSDVDDSANWKDKKFYCLLELTDNAKTYKHPGDGGTGEGNKSERIYLRTTDFYKKLMGEKYSLGAPTLYSLNNGTGTYTDAQREEINTLLETSGWTCASGDVTTSSICFKINPNNSPKWEISGYAYGKANNTQAENDGYRNYYTTNTGIPFYAMCGNDQSEIVPETIEILKYRVDNTGNVIDGSAEVLIAKGNFGGSNEKTQTKTITFDHSNDFETGQCYRIVATGEDLNGNPLVPISSDGYGFRLKSMSNPPEIKFTTDEDKYYSGADADAEIIKVEGEIKYDGTDKADDNDIDDTKKPFKPSIEITNASTNEKITGLEPDWSSLEWGELTDYTRTFSLTLKKKSGASFVPSATGKYKYKFTLIAFDKNGAYAEKSISFYIDNEPPKLRNFSITPVVSKTEGGITAHYINGSPDGKGTATDNNELKDVTYLVCRYDEESGKWIQLLETSLGPVNTPTESLPTTSISKALFGDGNDGKVRIKCVVIATDMVGNKFIYDSDGSESGGTASYWNEGTEINYTYDIGGNIQDIVYQETDRPVLTPTNFTLIGKDDAIKENTNLFGTTSNNKLLGTIEDDDGIYSVKIKYKKESDDGTYPDSYTESAGSISVNSTTYSLNYQLPSEEGKYEILIEVQDTEYDKNDESYKKFNKSEYRTYIAVSAGVPSIQLDQSGPIYVKAGTASTTISGTAKAANASTPVKVTGVNKVGDTETETGLTIASPAVLPKSGESDESKKWAFSDNVSIDSTEGTTGTLTYTATDRWSQTSAAAISYIVDSTPPEWINKTVGTNEFKFLVKGRENTSATWFKDTSLSITGYFKEETSGISTISYAVLPAGETDETKTSDDGTVSAQKVKDADGNVIEGYWKFTANVAGFENGSNKLTIIASDKAGNVSTAQEIIINVDTTDAKLESLFYKIGEGNFHQSGGTIYVNGSKPLIIYGEYSDEQSGVGETLKFTLGDAELTGEGAPSVTYTKSRCVDAENNEIADADVTGEQIEALTGWVTFDKLEAADKPQVKYWRAEFTPSEGGKLKVFGKNGTLTQSEASVFTIVLDTVPPKIQNIKISDSYEKKIKVGEATKILYYVKNSDKNFTISGVSIDNNGAEAVSIKITSATDSGKFLEPKNKKTVSEWSFEDINMKGWTNNSAGDKGAVAEIIVTDVAGNLAKEELTIIFDNEVPVPLHAFDEADKDVFFRFGTDDNSEYISKSSTTPVWDGKLDEDVGKKFSIGSYGNGLTIQMRGNITDSGSGVKMIYYKVFQSTPPTDAQIENLLKLEDYEGSFAPLSLSTEAEIKAATRRVFFTASSDNKDLHGKLPTAGTLHAASGKYYGEYLTTYKASISGFDIGKNYLVFVAEDNVGNTALDSFIATTNGKEPETETEIKNATKKYLEINIDQTPPVIWGKDSDITHYSNGKGTISLEGTVKDADSGVKSLGLSVTVNGVETKITPVIEPEDSTASDIEKKRNKKWTATLDGALFKDATGNVFVNAIAYDEAGSGNKASETVATVAVDILPPTVKLQEPDDADKGRDGIQVNGTITLNGSASDKNGLMEDSADKPLLTLYYTKNAALKETKPDTDSVSGNVSENASDAASKWVPFTHKQQNTTWSFTVNTKELSPENEKNVYLCVEATDRAGNQGYSNIVKVEVDQNTDRPVVKFSNMDFTKTNDDGYVWLISNERISGTIIDDDSGNTEIAMKYIIKSGDKINTMPKKADWASSDAKVVKLDGSTWNIDLTKQGEQIVYFHITDSNGTAFYHASDADEGVMTVRLSDGKNSYVASDGSDTKMKICLDTENPHLVFGYDGGDENGFEISVDDKPINYSSAEEPDAKKEWIDYKSKTYNLGGRTKKVFARFVAEDANGISKPEVVAKVDDFEVVIPSSKVKPYNEDKTEMTADSEGKFNYNKAAFFVAEIPTDEDTWTDADGKIWDGTLTVTAAVTDSANNTTRRSLNMTIDNTRPIITPQSPSSLKSVSGDVTVYGGIDTAYKMWFAVSPSDTVSPDDTETEIAEWKNDKDAKTAFQYGKDGKIAVRPSYSEFRDPASFWFVYFDGDTDEDRATTGAKRLNEYLIDYGIARRTANTNVGEGDIDNKFSSIVKLYVWIKAEDKAGNKSEVCHTIMLDPQGDRPEAGFYYPEKNGLTLGSTIDLRGNCSDPNGTVDFVWLQIISEEIHKSEPEAIRKAVLDYTTTLNDEGKNVITADSEITAFSPNAMDVQFWIDNGYTVCNMNSHDAAAEGITSIEGITDFSTYAIKAEITGSGSAWKLRINNNGEFDPITEDSVNAVAMRVYAEDNTGKASVYQQVIECFDSDIPKFGRFYLVQSDDADVNSPVTGSRAYEDSEESNWVRGKWYLTGTVEDSDKIKTLIIDKEDIIKDGAVVNSTVAKKIGTGEDSGTKIEFKYDLKTDGDGRCGVRSFKVEVEDYASTPHPNSQTVTVNFDNKKPAIVTSGKDFNISSTIKQTNNFYTFGTQVREDGEKESGFSHLVFFFTGTRKLDGESKTVLFDPMRVRRTSSTSTSDENIIPISETPGDYGIYWKTVTVGRDEDNLKKISVPKAEYDRNIHKGGFVEIGKSFYLIEDIEEKEDNYVVTLFDDVELQWTEAKFAYGLVVNNDKAEGDKGELQPDGYYLEPKGDDGDRMIENVSKSGTTWTWEANICSKNLSDGPVTLHYIAFDKAGNYREEKLECIVQNNAPRLASVTVWSDYSGSGTGYLPTDSHYASETKSKYASRIKPQVDGVYADKSSTVTEKLIVTLNNKGYSADSTKNGNAFMKVTGTVKVIPELVGGNGELFYGYKIFKNDGTEFKSEGSKTSRLYLTDDSGSNVSGHVENDDYPTVTDEETTLTWVNGHKDGIITFDGETILKPLGNSSTNEPSWFDITIWDSTEGLTPYEDSLNCQMQIALNNQYNDNEKPEAWIMPFYWNSYTDSSVVYDEDNEKLLGHIELENDLTQKIKDCTVKFTKTDGSNFTVSLGDDPKVSGQIKLEGYAYDAHRLKSIYARFERQTGLSDFTEVGTYEDGKWQQAASSSDYVFTAKDLYANADGHLVKWTLQINTANRGANYTDIDKAFEIKVKDARGTNAEVTGGLESELTSGDSESEKQTKAFIWGKVKAEANAEKNYYIDASCQNTVASVQAASDSDVSDRAMVYKREALTTYYKMDIVPYITGITTTLSDLKGNNPSVYSRTSQGHYPIRNNESITLVGFNLSADKDSVEYPAYLVETWTSGERNFSIQGMKALNNLNDNDARGSYTGVVNLATNPTGVKSIYQNYYNRQPNGDNNNLLTDDIVLDVWEFKDVGISQTSGYITEPIMKVNPKNGMLSFGFNSGPADYCMANGQKNSYQTWVGNYARFITSGFTVDENGNTHGITVGLDTNPGNEMAAGRMTYMTNLWGPSELSTNGNYNGRNTSRIDTIGAPKGIYNGITFGGAIFIEDRFSSPSLATTVHDGSTYVYLAYYDDLNSEIRFKYGDVSTATIDTSLVDTYNDDGTVKYYNGYKTTNWKGEVTGQYNRGYSFGQFQDQTKYYRYKEWTEEVGEWQYISGNWQWVPEQEWNASKNQWVTKTRTRKEYVPVEIKEHTSWDTNLVSNKDTLNAYYTANSKEASFDPDRHGDYYSIIAGPGKAARAGNYVSIDVIKGSTVADDIVVATWYDTSANKWWYSYKVNPCTDYDMSSTTGNGHWASPIALKSAAGQNCQIAVDPKGGIHIASYDSSKADLVYAYLSSYDDTTPQVVTVDAYAFTGTNLRIDTAVSEDGNYVVPYIGYYMSSVLKPKMAYLPGIISASESKSVREAVTIPAGADSSEAVTGKWECAILPTTSTYADNYSYSYVNIGLWKDASTGKAKAWSGTDVSYTNLVGLDKSNTSTVYGNSTTNPVMSYATRIGTRGHLETAQMK